MQHNVYLEWSINGKAYFQAFRALCRMRIKYASSNIINWSEIPNFKQVHFWTNVKEYWKKKLEESFTKEKEYFGE